MAAIATGTDKQVTWATSIKAGIVKQLTAVAGEHPDWEDYAEVQERLANVLAMLDKKTDAQWWIDRRATLLTTLIDKVV